MINNNILYINSKSDKEFAELVIEKLNTKLVFGKLDNEKTFVSRLVGKKGDTLLVFETKLGDIVITDASKIVAMRLFDPIGYVPKKECSRVS